MTVNALRKRISRKLAHSDERLGYYPNEAAEPGPYVRVNNRGVLVGRFGTLEDIGREEGVLRPHERVV